jgi:hypothetical protein
MTIYSAGVYAGCKEVCMLKRTQEYIKKWQKDYEERQVLSKGRELQRQKKEEREACLEKRHQREQETPQSDSDVPTKAILGPQWIREREERLRRKKEPIEPFNQK